MTQQRIFDRHLARLVEFKAEHGHCNVPKRWSENPKLASWVATQRRAYRHGDLSADRQLKLEAIGFDFCHGISNVGEDLEGRFRTLARYRKERKCDGIPASSDADPEFSALAKWIARMRRHHIGGTLPPSVLSRLLDEGVSLERDAARVAAQSKFVEAAFQRNIARLADWLDQKEVRDGIRDLAFSDLKGNKEVAACYRFVEHLVLKARQGLLGEAHRAQIVQLGFTVNKRIVDDVLEPGPSLRSSEGIEMNIVKTARKRRARHRMPVA